MRWLGGRARDVAPAVPAGRAADLGSGAGHPQLSSPSARRRALRRFVHGLGIVAGWCLFVWGWQRVLVGGTDATDLRALVLGALFVVPVLTLSWIAHNRGIYRRKGPRRSVPVAEVHHERDGAGRPVHAHWPTLAEAQRIEIVVETGIEAHGSSVERKRYVARGRP